MNALASAVTSCCTAATVAPEAIRPTVSRMPLRLLPKASTLCISGAGMPMGTKMSAFTATM